MIKIMLPKLFHLNHLQCRDICPKCQLRGNRESVYLPDYMRMKQVQSTEPQFPAISFGRVNITFNMEQLYIFCLLRIRLMMCPDSEEAIQNCNKPRTLHYYAILEIQSEIWVPFAEESL